jgi:hypothetical protein
MPSSPLRLVRDRVTRAELAQVASQGFGDMVKAVVDVERRIMAVGGELHSDEEAMLLDEGSLQSDLWGINLYPGEHGEGFVEFDSMINVRPAQGNPSPDVIDAGRRARIRAHEEANTVRWTGAFARALELFDLTATDERWRGHRRREILRARELFCGLFYAVSPTSGDAQFLRKYFLHFAMAVRRFR